MNRDWVEKDFYQTLGVPKDATAAQVKKAYRKLARELHPDAKPGDAQAEERFKEVSEAYDVLSDSTKRKEYDEARALFGNGGLGGPGGGFGGGNYGGTMDDLFSRMGGGGSGGLGDVLGGIFNRGRGAAGGRAPRRGADIESEVTLGFTEAIEGATVQLGLASEGPCPTCAGTGARDGSAPRVCPSCSGTGLTSRNAGGFAFSEPCQQCRGRGLVVDDPCPTCHGSGRGRSTRTVSARIPAGVRDGQRIRLKGKGVPGERGGPAGDLVVAVHVRPHPVFGRDGDNLTVTVPVTFTEAALGAKVAVPVLGGSPVTLRLSPGTANGRVLRVRGKGAPRKDGTRADLLVTVEIAVPQNLTGAAREALTAYAEATADHDPRAELLAAAVAAEA
ncbi:MAG: molecular chaperone DnaJ [Actinomycetota bacterium]|nr:MAG: molecular chaperone DnaJ [Actinomycetota bacterium]